MVANPKLATLLRLAMIWLGSKVLLRRRSSFAQGAGYIIILHYSLYLGSSTAFHSLSILMLSFSASPILPSENVRT